MNTPMSATITIAAFVQANGGHSGAPGVVSHSVTLMPDPPRPANPNATPPTEAYAPNDGLLAEGGTVSLNFQNPSGSTIAALPLGRRARIEIHLLDEE